MAKIIPLFKFNKKNYILLSVYYLILILSIFINAIKSLITNEIIYLKNYFKKLKYKNIVNVLIVL